MRQIFSIIVISVFCNAQDFPKGQIIEKVFCSADSTQTYALYLPSNYDSSRAWPIIYCFKPEANALFPLNWYSPIAEKYGYIILCSWNSQNGPWQVNIDAIHAIWKDTHKRFNINPRQIYATGFSGGSRTGTELAIRYPNQVTGIIGIGAGFSQLQEIPQQIPFRFYYGLAGYHDYNHSEMTFLDGILEQKKFPHRIAYFDGIHQWAPPEDFQLGLEWMEIQSIKSGLKAKDEKWIETVFQSRRQTMSNLITQGKIYDAAVWAKWIGEDFEGFFDTKQVLALGDSLKNTKVFRKWVETAKSIHDKEVEFQNAFDELQYTMVGPVFYADTDPNLKKILNTYEDWQSKLSSKEDLVRQAAYRCLDYVCRYSKAKGRELLNNGEIERAIISFDLATRVVPKDSMAHYRLAGAYSRAGQFSKSIKALEKAVKFGFNNLNMIQSDENLKAIRNEKGYQKIIERLSRPN